MLQITSGRAKDIKKIDYVEVLLLDRADAYKTQYLATKNPEFLAKGITAYKIADRFLDTIKVALTDLKSKLFWRSSARRLYENAIGACYLQRNLNDAFYFFEKSRAVLLQDQLKEQRWLGDSDIMKQTQLSKKIAQLEKEPGSIDKSSKKYSDLQSELLNVRQEFEKLRELIRTNSPLYYQNFVSYDSITIGDVKAKILKDHAALVEVFDGDSAVYVLAITKQESYLERINKTAFDNLSTAYVRYLSDRDLLNRKFDSFKDNSHQLYTLIFQDLNLPEGRIIVSPEGHYFPFESLVTNKQPIAYFLENHVESGTFFGLAPVQFNNGFAALSGSDQSLQRMQTFFRNSIKLVGTKATKNNFLKEYYRYKIVQLYTHATDSGSSGNPEIYFADSTLSLSDLFYENKPASSLIVLSACETAGGKLNNGEGVFSFNRQFAALGIPSCVSNLWQADNQASYRITELFYKYLAQGVPIDIALQSAKKEFISSSDLENKLPYYWAAPILVGKSGTIVLPGTFPWKWAGALAILVLIGIGGWRARQKRIQGKNKLGSVRFQS
jgi:CHAT domain-containing protein